MKEIHLFKKGFVIFLKGATFLDFIETRLSNYKPLAIWIHFPLFWRIFFSIRFKPHQIVSLSTISSQWLHPEDISPSFLWFKNKSWERPYVFEDDLLFKFYIMASFVLLNSMGIILLVTEKQ